jgi:hypothetical protein
MAKLTTFYGQHSDERILYTVREHKLVVMWSLFKAIGAGLVIFLGFAMIGGQLLGMGNWFTLLGLGLAIIIGGGGSLAVLSGEHKNVGYVTDRRIIRFQAETSWTVNSRSLMWEEAVKVKTFTPNFIYRILNIGTVVVHAKSTFITSDEVMSRYYVSDDDVELRGVHYYRDLGNYIDKILYLYRQKPKELETIRPFVAKPRGRRG